MTQKEYLLGNKSPPWARGEGMIMKEVSSMIKILCILIELGLYTYQNSQNCKPKIYISLRVNFTSIILF